MSIQHRDLARGRWNTLTFLEQMANVGSEVARAINWQQKHNTAYARLAFERALELTDLVKNDPKNIGKLSEICRSYEILVDFFAGENRYHTNLESLKKYYLYFNQAVAIAVKPEQ